MDKIIESFEEFINGANKVELCYDAETTGITRVIVSTLQYEYDDEGVATHPYYEVRHLGFAKRAAAEEVLANMRRTLDEEGYALESKTRHLDKLGITGIWDIHEVYSYQD